jgi:hypothetical protein
LVTVVPAGIVVKILAGPEAFGAACCAKATTLTPNTNTIAAVAEVIFFMFVLLIGQPYKLKLFLPNRLSESAGSDDA